MNPIHLHIDRLILEGFDLEPGAHAALQQAVSAELARLLATQGLSPALAAGGAWPSLRAAPLPAATPAAPAQLGGAIAHAVYGALGADE